MDSLVKQLNATYDFTNGGYSFDCSTHFTWGFAVGDKQFEIDSNDLAIKTNADGTCKLPFEDHWLDGLIIGTPFLRQFCSVFDLKNARIGLAPLK